MMFGNMFILLRDKTVPKMVLSYEILKTLNPPGN